MGNGPLLIGQGIGESAVWNPAVPAQNFANLLVQKKQKQQMEMEQLASQLSQVRSDGLRNDADRSEFFNQYNEIKNKAISNQAERDPMKRAMNKAAVRDELVKLQDYVNRSKQQGQKEAEWAKAYMANPAAYGDDAINAYRKSTSTSLTSPDVVKDFTTLQRQPNIDKINKDLGDIISNNLKQQVWQTDRKAGKEGNMTGTFELDKRAINPEQVYLAAATYYDLHPDFQRQMQLAMPDVYANNDPKQAKAIALKNYIDTGLQSGAFGPTLESKPQRFRADRAPDRFYEHQAWSLANKPEKTDTLTPAQTLIQAMQSERLGSGEKLLELVPTGQYRGNKPVIGMDKATGEHLFSFPAIIDKDKDNKDYIKFPKQTYRLNPAAPDYAAKAAQMAKEQNINLNQLNKIEGLKGGRGQMKNTELNAVQKPTTGAASVTVQLPDGTMGQIPSDKLKAFQSKYPKAKILK